VSSRDFSADRAKNFSRSKKKQAGGRRDQRFRLGKLGKMGKLGKKGSGRGKRREKDPKSVSVSK
jgi:hypothetical protein